MTLLRFLMWLSLIVWLGGIIFFAVLAPNVFAVLPTRQLAGNVVGRMLPILHWMGIASGLLFLTCSLIYSRIATGDSHPFALRHLLLYFMLLLTSISQFGVTRKMDALRKDMVNIDSVSINDPRRIQFNGLHAWSTRLEIGVLLSGLIVVYLNSRSS
ncbi:MAG TPA: DUF4149 domain-containing protein [Terriglobales bacterium]|jgi:hypothetical protein